MKKYKIYLLKSNNTEKDIVLKRLDAFAKRQETVFEFEWIPGTIPYQYEQRKYLFYNPNMIDMIEDKINRNKASDVRTGLLLDPILTKEDFDLALRRYYPQASVAADIYSKFDKKIPIYIITETAAFGYQSRMTMGRDLSDQYINGQKLIEAPEKMVKTDLEKLLNFYRNYEKNEKG